MVEDTHKDDYDEDSLVLSGTRAYSLADLAFPSVEKNTEIADKMGFMLLFKHEQMRSEVYISSPCNKMDGDRRLCSEDFSRRNEEDGASMVGEPDYSPDPGKGKIGR